LARDRTDLGPDDLGHGIGRGMGLTGDGPQDSQPLGRHLDAVLTEKVCRVLFHGKSLDQ
jgi:hypothetical protein